MDVLSLVDVNRIDVRSDKFRSLCDKYGDAKIYERILDFGQVKAAAEQSPDLEFPIERAVFIRRRKN